MENIKEFDGYGFFVVAYSESENKIKGVYTVGIEQNEFKNQNLMPKDINKALAILREKYERQFHNEDKIVLATERLFMEYISDRDWLTGTLPKPSKKKRIVTCTQLKAQDGVSAFTFFTRGYDIANESKRNMMKNICIDMAYKYYCKDGIDVKPKNEYVSQTDILSSIESFQWDEFWIQLFEQNFILRMDNADVSELYRKIDFSEQ